MKKLFAFVLCLSAFQAHAQKLYVRVVAGYSIPSLNSALVINGYPYTSQPPTNRLAPAAMNVSKGHASHGAGVLADLHAGYWFQKNIGVDVGLSYIFGPKHYTARGGFGFDRSWLDITQYASHPLFGSLSLALRDDRLLKHFYVNAGILLPLSNKIITESRPSSSNDTIQTYSHTVTKTDFSIGLHGTVGYDYPLTRRIAITACVSLNALSAWAKSSELEAFTINGDDYIEQIPEENRKTEYQRNYDVQHSTNGTILPAYQLSFSSLSFKIGVSVGL
jgi:hypothetical protein